MISVIIPARNEEDNIEACLRSILDQSLDEEFEIIVVDGDSSDGTAAIAGKFADKIITQTSPGIGGARRDGAAASLGDKLAFTDADTIVSEGWLEAVSSNLDRFSASTGPVIYANQDIKSELIQKWRSLYRLLYFSNFYYILGSNMAVKADIYKQIGGHSDISLLDDYDLSLRLCRAGASVRYDRDQIVYTSSRRASKLLTYTIIVAYGHYHYRISGDHNKLLHYPSPEEMTLRSLLPEKGLRPSLEASLEAAQSSFQSRIKKII